jgi:hypothetical protein
MKIKLLKRNIITIKSVPFLDAIIDQDYYETVTGKLTMLTHEVFGYVPFSSHAYQLILTSKF